MKNRIIAIMVWTIAAVPLFSQTNILDTPALKLDLPLFDLPYQIAAMDTVGYGFFSSYANPSMGQSLAVALDMFSALHYGMKAFYDTSKMKEKSKNLIYFGGVMLGDFILQYLPGGGGWMHEEFHRAVMSRFGVNSFNGMNLFPIGAELISVSKVTDEDLIRFKAESPHDFIRMQEAGIEGQYLLVNRLQSNNFFYNQGYSNESEYWWDTLNSHLYVLGSAWPQVVDAQTEKMNESELDIPSRDFTGFDLAGWVYDLFRPNEPYQARGIHPSGIGINRYRTTKDLTKSELDYLTQQGLWQIANYLSPMMFGIKSIPLWDSGFYGNFAFRHLLSSFGGDFFLQVFLKNRDFNFVFAYHNYLNYKHYFPAIEGELVDYPLSFFGKLDLLLSPRVMIGMQPKDQEFLTADPEFFGLIGCRVDFGLTKHFLPYLEFTAKTDGWVAGNEFLEGNVSFKLGVSARF
jgi:hypothetical protein